MAEHNTPIHEGGTQAGVPRWLELACRWLAIAGGLVLVAMMVMTVISILKRSFLGSPLPGDFELVEIASAIAVFSFLPYCQVKAGNVLVDFFTMRASPRVTHLLEALGDLLFMLCMALIGWRLWFGAREFLMYGEQTMVLRLPLWPSFILILPAVALLVVTCFFTMLAHLREARQ